MSLVKPVVRFPSSSLSGSKTWKWIWANPKPRLLVLLYQVSTHPAPNFYLAIRKSDHSIPPNSYLLSWTYLQYLDTLIVPSVSGASA